MKKILLSLLLFVGLLAFGLFTNPLSHLRNFMLWGPHTIHDYRTHPTRPVAKAPTPQPWAADTVVRMLPDSLLKAIDANDTHAFLVIQNGKIIFEKYWDGYTPQTLSGSFSAAKSIVSMLIGIAEAEGKIKSINDPVGNYLDHFKSGGLEKIRIKDLLTMSSGTTHDEADQGYFSSNARAYYGDDEEYVVSQLGVKEAPGVYWDYRSADTQVLGLIVEKVFGKNLSTLVSERFTIPMGAETEGKWLLDGAQRHEKSFCCFNGSARDYARFGQLMLTNGNWKGQQLVPEAYMKAALSPASYLKDRTENDRPVDFYGYQFWIVDHRGLKVPSMNGLFGQYVFAIREKNAIVVRLGETAVTTPIHHYQPENFLYIDAALELMK